MIDMKQSVSSCPLCKGSGFIIWTDEDGYEFAKPCKCSTESVKQQIYKASGFPIDVFERMTLDHFDTQTEEQKSMKKIATDYINNNGVGLGFFGKSGAGKTHICIATCQELIKLKPQSFRYVPYRTLVRDLRSNFFNQGKYDEILDDLISSDIVYIDDLLKLSQDQKGDTLQDELRVLYDVINERYLSGKKTIFSSEYLLKDILKIDEALGSRIREMIGPYGFKCEGKNHRL